MNVKTSPRVTRALLGIGLALLAAFSGVVVWMSTMLEDRQAVRERLGQLRGTP